MGPTRSNISTIKIIIAFLLGCTAVPVLSETGGAADVRPAINCGGLAGSGFPGSTMVIEKAEAVPDAPAGTVQINEAGRSPNRGRCNPVLLPGRRCHRPAHWS